MRVARFASLSPPPSRLTKHAPCGFVVIYRARDLRDENLS